MLINSIIRPKSSCSKNGVSKLLVDGRVCDRDEEISEVFNDHFVNVGSRIAQSIPKSVINHVSFLRGDYQNSFFIRAVSRTEVLSIISSLKSKSSEISVVPVRIFKYLAPIISSALSCIINKSFTSGIFPDSLKVAKVIPLPKPGDKSDLSNYRPILTFHAKKNSHMLSYLII